jgi:HK97 gp10 family phage protein
MARFIGLPKQTGRSVGASVQILGIPEAVAKLQAVDVMAARDLGLMLYRSAQMVYSKAKGNVPVESGNLRSGINLNRNGAYLWEVTASSLDGDDPDKNTKEYAAFVEFGTSKMAPRYFMTQAYQDTRPLVNAQLVALAARIEAL